MLVVFLHLLFQVPAIFTLGIALRGVLPFEFDKNLVPAFLVLCGLAVLYLPLTLTLALACVWPVALFYKLSGISLSDIPPIDVPDLSWVRLPRLMTHVVYKEDGKDYTLPEPTDVTKEADQDQQPPRRSFIPPLPGDKKA